LGRGEPDTAGSVVEYDQIARPEQLVGKERAQGHEPTPTFSVVRGLQVADGAVQDEGGDGLRVVALGQPPRPLGEGGQRVRLRFAAARHEALVYPASGVRANPPRAVAGAHFPTSQSAPRRI